MPTVSSARKRPGGGSFKVQGQGYNSKGDTPDSGIGASSVPNTMTSHGLPADSETEGEDDFCGNPMIIDELADINKTLEKQIDTLRLRLEFDKRHHDAEKHSILVEAGAKIKSKAEEINLLKQQMQLKDSQLNELQKENDKRDDEIADLRSQIESLNSEVSSAKAYANDLVAQITNLTREREQMEREGVYGHRDGELDAMKKEINELRLNLSTLEGELAKARDVIGSQNGKLKFAESDKKSLQLKFKEELARVSNSMRLEVEKMRDVMKKQWEEMRSLREQNFSMSKDIKDIRSLLVHGCLDDDAKLQQQQEDGQLQDGGQYVQQTTTQLPVPQSARGGKQVNSFNMGAMKPSLPVLSKEKKPTTRRK